MSKPKTAAQLVSESRARVVAEGGGYIPRTLLQPDEFALWQAIKGKSSVRATLVRLMRDGSPSRAIKSARMDQVGG